MKKADSFTLIGIIMGVIMIILGMRGEAGLKIFWDLPSIILTIGGSFCALMIKYSLVEIKNLGKIFLKSIKVDDIDRKELIIKFLEISKRSRMGSLLSLENEIDALDNDFMKKGLQMVVDDVETEVIREILELEIDQIEKVQINEANIFKTWGRYAPAFGIVGTLIGIIQMISNLTNPENIASGMIKAVIAAFYGAILSNLIFNPIAENLTIKGAKEIDLREMMVEGILAIKSGINPRILEEKLVIYLLPSERLEYLNAQTDLSGGVGDND